MTNSELFVLGTNKYKTLPYLLVDLGYEVWLGIIEAINILENI